MKHFNNTLHLGKLQRFYFVLYLSASRLEEDSQAQTSFFHLLQFSSKDKTQGASMNCQIFELTEVKI